MLIHPGSALELCLSVKVNTLVPVKNKAFIPVSVTWSKYIVFNVVKGL